MPNLNKVMLMGNLTRDPEVRFMPNGKPVCELGMAINRVWNDQSSGEQKKQVCYVDCTAFGRQAETLERYMKKGRPLYIEGRLDFQSWETQEGQKRSKLKVIIENFQFLGGRDEAGQGGGGGAPSRPASQAQAEGGYGQSGGGGASYGGGMDDDDIPF